MKLFFSGLLSFFFLFSFAQTQVKATDNVGKIFPQKLAVPELFQPLTLNRDTTLIYLSDFFIDPKVITNISLPAEVSWKIDKDNIITVIAHNDLPLLSEMKLKVEGFDYCVLLKKSNKQAHEFTFDPKGQTYKTVQLAGEMNNWSPKKNPFVLKDGIWKTTVEMNPGVYHYQIVVDGKWILDPANPDSVDNNNGGFNSVFSAGVTSTAKPELITTDAGKTQFDFNAKNDPQNIVGYWQNFKVNVGHGKDLDYFIEIPEAAKKMKRSYIRVYSYNQAGESNNLLIPLEYGEVLQTPSHLDRNDKEADIIYFVLVDRFCDGDSTNDKPIANPLVKQKANYFGGDLAGITKQIKAGYFAQLHANTIWISPIVQNPETAWQEFPEPHDWYTGYHGYWPISLNTIDHHFGNNEVMKEMVETAHHPPHVADDPYHHEINILLDLVANHVHEDYPLLKKHPEWKTQLDLPDGRKNIRLWDEYRLTTWFDTFLPTLDFTNKEVLKMEVDSSLYWIEKFDIDGFRHDATKHIPTVFWRALTLELKKKIEYPKKKTIYQLGETYGSKELISSYIGSGMMDGQFDFNLYFSARTAFAQDDAGFEKMAKTLQESLDAYGSHHLMGNISGNHDQPRFISLAGGALSFKEDARKAGWARDVEVGNDTGYLKLAMLHAFNATIPGVPVIYYGDEIGMPGAGDPDNRRMMRFDNLSIPEQVLKSTVEKLFKLRSSHLSLIYGDFKLLRADKHVLSYQRQYFDETAFVVFNSDNKPQKVTLDLPFYDPQKIHPQFDVKRWVQSGPTAIEIEMPAKSFEIIFVNKN